MLDVAAASYFASVKTADAAGTLPADAHCAALREALLAGFMFAGRVQVWAAHNHLRGDSFLGHVKRELMANYPVEGTEPVTRPDSWAELKRWLDERAASIHRDADEIAADENSRAGAASSVRTVAYAIEEVRQHMDELEATG
jgi:hypothetical protein